MSMTLVLAALSPEHFEQVESDPLLLRWIHERALLDWSTTLREYYFLPEQLDPNDLRRMDAVDGFGLRAEDIVLVDYLAVARALDEPREADALSERVRRALSVDPWAPIVLDDPAIFDAATSTEPDTLFDAEGELEYDTGYGNCLFWSHRHFADVVTRDRAWLAAQEDDADVQQFIARVLAMRSDVVGVIY